MRVIAGCDVPGLASSWTSRSRSLKDGTTDVSSSASAAIAATAQPPTASSVARGRADDPRERGGIERAETAHDRGLAGRPRGARPASTRLSAGVTVRATSVDASTAAT